MFCFLCLFYYKNSIDCIVSVTSNNLSLLLLLFIIHGIKLKAPDDLYMIKHMAVASYRSENVIFLHLGNFALNFIMFFVYFN